VALVSERSGSLAVLVAAGVSVALRDVLANLMAGVILTWDRTISKNDVSLFRLAQALT